MPRITKKSTSKFPLSMRLARSDVSLPFAVMYLGDIAELGPVEEAVKDPPHRYTQALSSAVPVPDPVLARKETKVPLKSFNVPSLIDSPPVCKFHPRCPYAMEKCSKVVPELREIKQKHQVACRSLLTGWQVAISPRLGRTSLGVGVTIIVFSLMSLALTDKTSPQFVVGSVGLLATTAFTLLGAWDVRRQVKEE